MPIVKMYIIFTEIILSSLLTLYLLISKTFSNFAAVGSTHPIEAAGGSPACLPWDALAPSRYSW